VQAAPAINYAPVFSTLPEDMITLINIDSKYLDTEIEMKALYTRNTIILIFPLSVYS